MSPRGDAPRAQAARSRSAKRAAREPQAAGAKARGDKRSEDRAKRLLGAGALALLAGIAIVATGTSDVGMICALGGLCVLIFGIHTFGRLGAPVPRT